jgi:hypothetical protein
MRSFCADSAVNEAPKFVVSLGEQPKENNKIPILVLTSIETERVIA